MRGLNSTEIELLWSGIGIKSGDNVLIHSSLVSLGRTSAPHFLGSLLDAVGPNGCLILPSFSYSIFRGEIYDPRKSRSRVGILSEIALLEFGGVRSLDPAFSMVAVGCGKDTLMQRKSIRSVGPGSVYESLVEKDFKVLLAGVDFSSLSFFMHLERLLGVEYRYEKFFAGWSKIEGKVVRSELIHFVEKLNYGFRTDRNRIGDIIKSEGILNSVEIPYGEIQSSNLTEIMRVVMDAYESDPNVLIKLDR